jgi:hypothetical protein
VRARKAGIINTHAFDVTVAVALVAAGACAVIVQGRATAAAFNGSALPENDVLLPHVAQRFVSCAAVGPSAGLLSSPVGQARCTDALPRRSLDQLEGSFIERTVVAQVIDEHEIVLRFHHEQSAPRPEWAAAAGSKTTLRLLDHEDTLRLLAMLSKRHSRRALPISDVRSAPNAAAPRSSRAWGI